MKDFTEAYAMKLDREDPLGALREEFSIQNKSLIYLDGNSLGMLVKDAAEDVQEEVEHAWGVQLIRSWNQGWYEKGLVLGDKIAKIAGASDGEIAVADSTSVNLYKLAYAALRLKHGRRKIITDDLNFPSDIYILKGLAASLGGGHEVVILESADGMTIAPEQVREAIDGDTALVSFSHVVFKSAFMYDMERVTAMAHEHGALTLWDLSHSIGSVPVELNRAGADLAVGCTYKYLNGGPGSPAFLYVRKDLQDQLTSPLQGWFGEENPFDFGLEYRPAKGIRRFLAGTPPILSMVPVERTLEMMIGAGIHQIREKSIALSEYLVGLVVHELTTLGFSVGVPVDVKRRGSHVSLKHPEAYRICKALIDPAVGNREVIPDFREPDHIRLGITPLYTRFIDLYHAVQELKHIVEYKLYENYSSQRDAVT